MQQAVALGDDADMGGGGDDGVGQSGLGVNPDMRLHAEVPLAGLFGQMHLWVALAVLVLRRGQHSDDRGIDYRAFPEHQPTGGEMHVDSGKDALGQLVRFQQAAELEQGGGVGRRLAAVVDADEAADRLAVVESFPLPLSDNPKHSTQRNHSLISTPTRAAIWLHS